MCVLMFKSSHCPNGKLTFGSLLAGRWCRCRGWHSDHLIVHHQWEHSWLCARSSSKVPNAPMGKMLMCLPRLTLAQLRTLRSTTECTCRRELEKIPTPQWDTMGDSRVACWLQGGGVAVRSGTVTISSCTISGNTAGFVRAHPQKFPSPRWENCAPMGDSRFARCLQGGGVYVNGGTVSIVNSQIYSNRATYVRADIRNFPSPR
jgi:hypothetical protein